MEITKEQFEEYRRCQQLGYYNMLDYGSWSRITTLSKSQWISIISNYTTLASKYN